MAEAIGNIVSNIYSVERKVLKPDVYQEFELKEKTIISHNVAM